MAPSKPYLWEAAEHWGVALHFVGDTGRWPEPTIGIADIFSRHTRPRSEEIVSDELVLNMTGTLYREQCELVDSLYALMPQWERSIESNCFEEHSLWTFLISHAMRATLREPTTLFDCDFVCPRSMQPGSTMKGTASLLALIPATQRSGDILEECSLEDIRSPKDDVTERARSVPNTAGGSSDSQAYDTSNKVDRRRGARTDGDLDATAEIDTTIFWAFHPSLRDVGQSSFPCKLYEDMPSHTIQSHILATTLFPIPLLPVICVANEDNIVPLMCAALHQRRVLHREDLPVVGILHSRASDICQVWIGWVDASQGCAATRLHIAVPSPETRSYQDGVFDLASPPSASAFLLFLMQLGTYVTTIRVGWPSEERPSLDTEDLVVSWRSDTDLHQPGAYDLHGSRLWIWRCDEFDWRSEPPAEPPCIDAIGEVSPMPPVVWSVQENMRLMQSDFGSDDIDRIPLLNSYSDSQDGDSDGNYLDEPNPYPDVNNWSLDHHVFTLPLPPGRDQSIYMLYSKYMCDLFDFLHYEQPPLVSDLIRYNCSALAFVTLVREIALLGYPALDAWRSVWHDIMTGVVTTSHEAYCHMNDKGLVNYLRCAEYDHLARAYLSIRGVTDYADDILTPDLLPYSGIHTAFGRYMRAVTPDYCSPRDSSFDAELRFDRSEHSAIMTRAINVSREISLSMSVAQRGMDYPGPYLEEVYTSYMDEHRERMRRYPAGGCVDASVTVTVDGLLAELCDTASSSVELANYLLFFRGSGGIDSLGPKQFHLPLLLVNHQADGMTLDVATRNVQRFGCVSAVRFLAALGIKDFPVYGLATYGPRGVLCQAWYSESDNVCYIVDRDTQAAEFDLRKDNDVLRFIGFLHKLKGRAEELEARFEGVRAALLERMRTPTERSSLWWTLRSQFDEHDLWPQGQDKVSD